MAFIAPQRRGRAAERQRIGYASCMARSLVAVVALFCCAGCGGDDQLDEPENVRIWATTASALAVYANTHDTLAIVDGESEFLDPECPLTADDGDTFTIGGGCTDSAGVSWVGSATVERTADDLELTLDAFGSHGEGQELVKRRGKVVRKKVGDAEYTFRSNLVVDGGMRTTIDYSGRVTGGYDARSVWSGSGRVSRDGVLPPTGTIDAVTEAEVVDDAVCSGQPVSGRTTIMTEDQNAVVLYDGETDCDDQQAVRYRVDGLDRGRLTGISCGVTAHRASSSGANVAVLALSFLVGARVLRRRGGRARKA